MFMNGKNTTKHRQCIRERYRGYKVIPITNQYYEETEYSEVEKLIRINTAGLDDYEYYKLIAVNSA